MAERRMFAKSIISSGRFLRMPPSSRLLYYDLGMYADDDGVVEAFSVMRQTQATEDDLRVLVSKGFVRILNDELVALITDWKVNNFIRNDRYHPSIYTDLLLQISDGIPTDNQVATNGIPRLGKDSIDKDSIGKDNTTPKKELVAEFEKLWEMYPKKQGKKNAEASYLRARKDGATYEEVEQGINAYVNYIRATNTQSRYIKHGSTFFNQRAWQDDWTVDGGYSFSSSNKDETFEEMMARL